MTLSPPRRQTARQYEPGQVIAEKYELRSLLGEGGMGSVWLASNRLLDLPVALKLLRADFDAQDAGKRLLKEARAAARIGHRAIVRVFDFGHTEHGDPFIVMELLEGQTLAEILATRNGPLGAIEAVRTLLPIVDAVAEAHDAGIVHRDLKPANIFLVREQRRTQPKVVDFGIAKMDPGPSDPGGALTRQGEVVGSPGYMSPEQARGESQITLRTDVWALCVVLYECVTGGSPFRGDNYNAWLRAIIEDTVKPTVDLSAGDDGLWTIIERGLRKSADERWASMRELGEALAGWLVSHRVEQDICGDPVTQYLGAGAAAQALPPSRSPLIVSLGGPGPSATTVHALDALTPADASGSNARPSFGSGLESASAVARTKPPEAPARTSFVLVTVGAAALVAATIGTIVAFSRGAPDHEATGVTEPASGYPAPAAVRSTASSPTRPLAESALKLGTEELPSETAAAPTPAPSVASTPEASAEPVKRSGPVRASTTIRSSRGAVALPSASVVPPNRPIASPGNPELKDPY
jgi:serine/threonine-protein kinase